MKRESLVLINTGTGGSVSVEVSADFKPSTLVTDDGRTVWERQLEDVVKFLREEGAKRQ